MRSVTLPYYAKSRQPSAWKIFFRKAKALLLLLADLCLFILAYTIVAIAVCMPVFLNELDGPFKIPGIAVGCIIAVFVPWTVLFGGYPTWRKNGRWTVFPRTRHVKALCDLLPWQRDRDRATTSWKKL